MSGTLSSFSTPNDPPTAGSGGAAAKPGAAPTGSVLDLFAQLKEFQWKGVAFPCVETGLDVRQDLVVHKFADRNGAYVEGTGRHPVQITALIPFLNTIYTGKNETWAQGNLYPYQWRFFLKACLEGTSGTLQHPELGNLNCKVELAHTDWKGSVTGGVWVHATWVESDDTQADQLGQDLSDKSPIAQMMSSADGLDEQIATLDSLRALTRRPFPPMQYSFDQLASAITGSIDSVTVLEKEFQGRTDNLIYQCNRIENSLEMEKNAAPTNWPIFQNCERLKDAAYALKALPQVALKRPVLTLTTQKASTLGELVARTGARADDLIVLNAALVASPVVPANTVVRYYAPAA